jgi:hypothetical protein
MDSGDVDKIGSIDKAAKRKLSHFSKDNPKGDEFDPAFKEQIDSRASHIRDELRQADHDSDKDPMNKPFTKTEMAAALKRLKKKLWKSCGNDGIHNWMVYLAGSKFHDALLLLYNKCWAEGHYPDKWFETLISYIYKGKGPIHELTSYRPIALTSTLVNLLKSMMLARIAPVIIKQIHESQGGFRSGSGSKEQLWALVEFLEDCTTSETPALFCTTDVHKAFDQVYRNGTIYMLYCHGIRGRMLHMIDLWITNNIATQLWRGHLAPTVHLDANGLRQGCVLSPILYLLIINALVADAPNNYMPDWDVGFMKTAFSHGVQPLRSRTDLGDWLVYLFVDDTAFVSTCTHTNNEMLARYHNFTVKWRIRVNPDKCKLLKNRFCTDNTLGVIGSQTIQSVEFLKYLGYWLGLKGRSKNDDHIKAQATQLRFKIRALRPVIGEYLSKVYFESYSTPSILHGSELGLISSTELDNYQLWGLSEVLGIGRGGKAEGLMEGDVRKLCVYADYSGPTWSQIRARNAMVTYRSILRMGDHTLPKEALNKRLDKNILVGHFTRRMGEGNVTARDREKRLQFCKALNTDNLYVRHRWKAKLKEQQKTEYNNWIGALQIELRTDVANRANLNLARHVAGFGLGTAYLLSIKPGSVTQKSLTHMDSKLPAHLKRPIRRLKAGLLAHTSVMANMHSRGWHSKTFDQKLDEVLCECGQDVQDAQHTMFGCDRTNHLLVDCMARVDTGLKSMVRNKALGAARYTHLTSKSTRERMCDILHAPYSDSSSALDLRIMSQYGLAAANYLDQLDALHKRDSMQRSPSLAMNTRKGK